MSFYSHFTSYLLGICKKPNANKLLISILRLCYYIKTDFYSYIPAEPIYSISILKHAINTALIMIFVVLMCISSNI